jgi:CDP-diacylglycerol--glycerol-3-phosphate 3-phosphatidyltransferase
VNLPNRLTISRILLVPFILLFMLPISPTFLNWLGGTVGLAFLAYPLGTWTIFVMDYGIYVAAFLFLVAALTDSFDGAIARKRGIVTNLGKFLDPVADKILVASILVALVQLTRVGAIAVIVILLREFVVSALRMVASDKGIVISASILGKVKTVTQIVAILLVMVQDLYAFLVPLSSVAMLLAVLITLYSGVDYLVKHAAALRET